MSALPRWMVYYGAVAAALLVTGAVTAEEGSIPGAADMEAEMEQQATLSGPQQAAWAQEELSSMEQLARRIQGLLDQARRERDIIKVTCLNDKLTQINVSIRSFQSRMSQHGEAVQSRNAERRDHQYRLMVILAQRTRTLRIEAEGCVGETDVVFGRTRVETEIDPNITPTDPSEVPPVDFIFDRPPSASGYY